MQLTEYIRAQGHPNLLGTHRMTFEITKDRELSNRGDCVIGVNATKAAKDLRFEFRQACMQDNAIITFQLKARGITETIRGFGSRSLTFAHPNEIVGRKSSFASDRTIMIRADKAAYQLDRGLIKALKSSETALDIQMLVEF